MVDQEEIHRKCNSDDPKERIEATDQLLNIFESVSEKKQIWQDLHRLTSDKDRHVRRRAAEVLGTVIQLVPDKEKAWEDLVKLISDEDSVMRWEVIKALRNGFQHVPDKEKAWGDIFRLTSDEDSDVRWKAARILGTVFQCVPDKEKVWKDLHGLTSDKDNDIRLEAAGALDTCFRYAPDKEEAWEDLHILISDKDKYVRRKAARALGTSFQYLPYKEKALEDLRRLTLDKDRYARNNAYHSLGRISIYKASQSRSEEAYLEELKKAIEFFEKPAKESTGDNPSRFCFPFYRSFYTIISAKKLKAENEVIKYLSEAKNAIDGSENKKLLLEAVENLANALKEVHNLENIDLEAKKGELNFYRKYCEQAAELMKDTEEAAPFATATVRKGFPILDRKLKSLLEEIQEKAKTACQVSQGTPTQEIACAVSREVQKWEISNPADMAEYIEDISYSLKGKVQSHPENKYLLSKIEIMTNETDLTKKFQLLSYIIGEIPTIKVVPEETIRKGFNEIKQNIAAVDEKIEKINISLKPRIREELIVSVGPRIGGVGFEHTITIPLKEISYSELKEDLKKITGIDIDHFSKLPKRLAEKIKGYLTKTGRIDILEKLT